MDRFFPEHLVRTIEDVAGRDELLTRLASGRPLRIKFGVDCTAPHLHLGHAVNLWLMRHLQDLGHTVVFLLGDLTTRIGDPTGRSETRPVLTQAEIDANAAAFLAQVSLVLRTDADAFEVRRNSQWYADLGVARMLELFALVTHAQLVSRDMFAERIASGRPIAMSEFTYPIFQGYDSFVLDSDLTIVGSDQLFNELMGRAMQERLGAAPQVVITTVTTPGLDGGAKQSKSRNNYVALTDPPAEKFGKVMSLPDGLVGEWARVYTTLAAAEVEMIGDQSTRGGTPGRDAKLRLASAIVERFHGADVAAACAAEFRSVFAGGDVPSDLPELCVDGPITVRDLVRSARPELSGRGAKRLMEQGAVWLNDRRLADADQLIDVVSGDVLKTGKRTWHRLSGVVRASGS